MEVSEETHDARPPLPVRRRCDLVPEAGVAVATGQLPGCMASMVLWKEVKLSKERVGRVLELALEPAPSRCPARGLPARSLPSHLLIARSLQTSRDPRALKAAGGRPAELDTRESIGTSTSAVRTPTGA